jgi:hypothetical protein
MRILHPYAHLFLLLLVITSGSGLVILALGLWRLLRGPKRGAAFAWAVAGLLPVLVWSISIGYGLRQMQRGQRVSPRVLFKLMEMAGASLMELQATYGYPHRLETGRLVMFYNDRVNGPRSDSEVMDRHLARMEGLTGLRLRTKIHWVRGPLLGRQNVGYLGLAVGTSRSPASELDRHELAHAFLYQHNAPDTEPPALLVEGWAESQSLDHADLSRRALGVRRDVERWRHLSEPALEEHLTLLVDPGGYGQLVRKARASGTLGFSYLREATGLHGGMVVYFMGGAFADFLLRKYGPDRFVELYLTCRAGTFGEDCRRVLGVDFDTLEQQFWDDVERSARDEPASNRKS